MRAFGREARLARGDVDRAGRGVLAVQRALRAAQDFDLLDIEEVERRGGAASVINLVDVDADARLDAVVGEAEWRAEAANVHAGVARITGIELHRRLQLRQPADVEGAGRFDRVRIQHRDRQRHVLHRLFAAPCSNSNVLDFFIRRDVCVAIRGKSSVRATCDCQREQRCVAQQLAVIPSYTHFFETPMMASAAAHGVAAVGEIS